MINHASGEVDANDDKLDVQMVDAREIAAPQRHPFIFQIFDDLPVGAAFILVNGHDPIPLYYQFTDRRKDQFRWEYEKEGPDLWQIRITKIQ